MKKLIPSRLLEECQKKVAALIAFVAMPFIAMAQEAASDVVEPPKEFSPANWDWTFIATIALVCLIIWVVARVFDIGALAEKITGKTIINWNKANGWIAIIFLALGAIGFGYEMLFHGKYLLISNASSAHGQSIDSMFTWTFAFTFIVFVITEVLLFYFMFRYSYREGGKALYFFHNNKLEMIWTVVPAIVLTFLVLRGFNTWSRITSLENIPKDAQKIELFAYQFGWKARYAGEDNILGESSFTLISGKNPLGLAVGDYVDTFVNETKMEIAKLDNLILHVQDSTLVWTKQLSDLEARQNITAYPAVYKDIKEKADDANSGAYLRKLEKDKKRKELNLTRIANYRAEKGFFNNTANDDKVTTELVLVKNKSYVFKFRARDVIHSAYMPEFRAQMNVVPGMGTHFSFIPIRTTVEARKLKNDTAFDFYLYCNKICGAAHYNMKIKITVVESEQEYKTWLAAQPAVFAPQVAAPAPAKDSKDSAKASPTVAINK